MDPELARVGAAFGHDGARLEPDQLGAARAESAVAPEGEFARPPVELAIATFHRMGGQRISERPPPAAPCPDLHGAPEPLSGFPPVFHERQGQFYPPRGPAGGVKGV